MEIICSSVEETLEVASRFGKKLVGGEVVALSGDLGAGKTVFAKGVANALGVGLPVVSPTFTVLRQYQGEKLVFNHLDLYRIKGEDEAEAIGLIELFEKKSVTLIEWAENAEGLLPNDTIRVDIIRIDDNTRKITWDKNI